MAPSGEAYAQPDSAAHGAPNIIVILADDLGYANEGGRFATQNIDRLAAGGVRFMVWYFPGLCSCTPLRGGRLSHYEGGTRIPLLMRWPDRINGGTIYHDPVSLLDVLPTSVSAATHPAPAAHVARPRLVTVAAAPAETPAAAPTRTLAVPAVLPSTPPPRLGHGRISSCSEGARAISAFYVDGRRTANGERFDPNGMTAAVRLAGRRAAMCDYSLHNVASRPASVGDELVTTEFVNAPTHGFAAIGEPNVAVCLLPGTEIAFREEARYEHPFARLVPGFGFGETGEKVARFRRINPGSPKMHHDALEFASGQIVPVSRLCLGQRASVLQLPMRKSIQHAQQPSPTELPSEI